jgi:tRNA threonylcarbamoyladenosine biosynthesis protein TsaE
MINEITCTTPDETYNLGAQIGGELRGGDVVLLYGGLGAGKTLLTKGILSALDFDVDEVTSPSFTLVNRYKTTRFDVYHIDLWRLDNSTNAAMAIGLDEILEDNKAVVIIEWADRLSDNAIPQRAISIVIEGDGDEPRKMTIETANLH